MSWNMAINPRMPDLMMDPQKIHGVKITCRMLYIYHFNTNHWDGNIKHNSKNMKILNDTVHISISCSMYSYKSRLFPDELFPWNLLEWHRLWPTSQEPDTVIYRSVKVWVNDTNLFSYFVQNFVNHFTVCMCHEFMFKFAWNKNTFP